MPSADHRVVAGDYFRAVGIPLIEGRFFDSRDDASAPPRLIVSKSFAEQYFPGISAVGQRLGGGRNGEEGGEIIGVVGDVSVDNEGHATQYILSCASPVCVEPELVADADGGDHRSAWSLGALQTAIRHALAGSRSANSLVMYRPTTLDEVLGRGVAQRVFTLQNSHDLCWRRAGAISAGALLACSHIRSSCVRARIWDSDGARC